MTTRYLDFFSWLRKPDQKRILEEVMGARLTDGVLSEADRYYIAEASANTHRGLYGLAFSFLKGLGRGAAEYASLKTRRAMLSIPSQAALLREVKYLEGTPSLEEPIFR